MLIHSARARYMRRVQPQDYQPVEAEVELSMSLDEDDDVEASLDNLMQMARAQVHAGIRGKKEEAKKSAGVKPKEDKPKAEKAEKAEKAKEDTSKEDDNESDPPKEDKPKPAGRKNSSKKADIEADRATEPVEEETTPEVEVENDDDNVENIEFADSKELHRLVNKAVSDGLLDSKAVKAMLAAESVYKISDLAPAAVIAMRKQIDGLFADD